MAASRGGSSGRLRIAIAVTSASAKWLAQKIF